MALSDSKVSDIYEGLKYKFLFNNDINCIHILLNLYELEDNINNIVPSYISIKRLRKNIRKALKDRRGNHLIAYNLGELIHEDINRLELLIYLEGYKAGYLNKKHINDLENITLRYFSISELYNKRYLFNFDSSIEEVNNFKTDIYKSFLEEKQTLLGNTMSPIPRLGINKYDVWGEALHGVVGRNNNSGATATSFPNSIAVGSTWDPELIKKEAIVIADEARGFKIGRAHV